MIWGREIARSLYGLTGDIRIKYLDINDKGHLVLKIGEHEIDLYELMKKYNFPGVHLRILSLIRIMMDRVVEAFNNAMKKHNSKLGFIPIYPLKSNSSKIVIDTIWSYGE
ncbi:MAG: arginine decarboxylase, partial [Staphylothermus sp.]|nr:arginine decarboxylase [Staphylothermus sp.]